MNNLRSGLLSKEPNLLLVFQVLPLKQLRNHLGINNHLEQLGISFILTGATG